MEIGSSISGHRVVSVLDRLKEQGRKPETIRVDNGPEFLSGVFKHWCKQNSVCIHYIQLGKPTQNSLVERLNGSCRRELFVMYMFIDMRVM